MKKSEILVTVTYESILNSGNWDKFCNSYGIDEWILNEGRADSSDQVYIRLQDAENWNLIQDDEEETEVYIQRNNRV